MKVLFVTNSAEQGGATNALINTLPYLKQKSIEPIVTLQYLGFISSFLENNDIQCFPIYNRYDIYPPVKGWEIFKFPYRLIKYRIKEHFAYANLCRIVEKIKPNIIHSNVGTIHIGYKVAKKYHIPHVWHLREYQIEDFGIYPFPSYQSFLNKIHDRQNHCIAVTNDIFKHFNLSSSKDILLYDAVINKSTIRMRHEKKDKFFLFVGRLEEAKGIKELIRAYDDYACHGGLFDLYIAGEEDTPNYINDCQKILHSPSLPRVHFLGFRNDIQEIMYESYAIIVPSKSEGFGFITVEGMFNGSLVLGKNTGGTKEQFDNGYNFCGKEIGIRFYTEKDLTNRLFDVERMQNAEYEDYIKRAQKTVCEYYDIKTQVAKLIDFYNSILKTKN